MEKIKRCMKLSTLFYVVGGLFIIAWLFLLYNTHVYVYGLLSAESISWASDWKDIIAYYFNNGMSQLAYGLILIGIGRLLPRPKQEIEIVEPVDTIEIINEEEQSTQDHEEQEEA